MYAIFEVKAGDAGRIEEVLKDDLVSRQSIAFREASALGLPGPGTFVLIEGKEAAIVRAGDLFGEAAAKVEGDRAKAVFDAFKVQEDDAARGMGLLFG